MLLNTTAGLISILQNTCQYYTILQIQLVQYYLILPNTTERLGSILHCQFEYYQILRQYSNLSFQYYLILLHIAAGSRLAAGAPAAPRPAHSRPQPPPTAAAIAPPPPPGPPLRRAAPAAAGRYRGGAGSIWSENVPWFIFLYGKMRRGKG